MLSVLPAARMEWVNISCAIRNSKTSGSEQYEYSIVGSDTTGLNIDYTNDMILSNVNIEHPNNGISIGSNSYDISINGGHVDESQNVGLTLAGYDLTITGLQVMNGVSWAGHWTGHNFSLVNCIFDSNAMINITGAEDWSIIGSSISSSSNYGLAIRDSSRFTIDNNNFLDNTNDAIDLSLCGVLPNKNYTISNNRRILIGGQILQNQSGFRVNLVSERRDY